MEDQINKDYIAAMKSRDKVTSSVLNFLRAKLKDVKIANQVDQLSEADVIAVVKKQVKQRQDSIEQFTKGGRQDLADKEQAELEILERYLPAQMSEDQVQAIIQDAIKETGAQSMKDMGTLMKHVMGKIQGQADNKLVSELVKKALN